MKTLRARAHLLRLKPEPYQHNQPSAALQDAAPCFCGAPPAAQRPVNENRLAHVGARLAN